MYDHSPHPPLRPSGLQLLQAPAIEPLTTKETMDHLRLDSSNLEPTPGAPTVALAGAGAGNVTNGVHRYRLTFVTADGETDGGDISAPVTVVDSAVNGRVALSVIPLGGGKVTQRKIYRTQAGGSVYLFLATLADNTTVTYQDNIADAGLGAGVPSLNTTSDPTISELIVTARQLVESWLHRALIQQKWRVFFNGMPGTDVLLLPMPPLVTVDFFKYKAWNDGTLTDVDALVYATDIYSLPGRITRKYSQIWPNTYPEYNSVQVDITCGYGVSRSDIPAGIRNGMKVMIAGLYENPQAYGTDTINQNPALKRILRPFRYEEFI